MVEHTKKDIAASVEKVIQDSQIEQLRKSNGQLIGYKRVSTIEQNDERQLYGLALDRIFTDKASGSSTNRPALQEMLNYIRGGDTLIVDSIDRLARNLHDLKKMIEKLTDQGVTVYFRKENMKFSGDSDAPLDNFLLAVLGAFAEFERAMILERQREGIALARQKGKYKGRLPSLTRSEAAQLRIRAETGVSKTRLARDFKIARKTLYKYLEPEKHPNLHYRDDPMYCKEED